MLVLFLYYTLKYRHSIKMPLLHCCVYIQLVRYRHSTRNNGDEICIYHENKYVSNNDLFL
jgi:hypothetical protein